MAEELYPGASFAAPFAEASAMAPISQIPTNILQSIQAARASARADDALALQQERFAFDQETQLRKQRLEDVDRELTSQLDNPAVSRSRRGYGGGARYGTTGQELGPAGVAQSGLRKGSKASSALAPEVAAEQGVIAGVGTADEYIRNYGREADKQHGAYEMQQRALEGFDFSGPAFAAPPEGEVASPRPSGELNKAASAEGLDASRTVGQLLKIVSEGRESGGEPQFYGPDELAELLVAEESNLIGQGFADISDDLMTQVVQEVWRRGPPPPEDTAKTDLAARQFLDRYLMGDESVPTESDALEILGSQGLHPEEAAAVITRINEIAPAYRSDQQLRTMGLLEPGQSALTESDMAKNPVTFLGLPPDYSRTPDQFAHQIYRTAWGEGIDSRTKGQVLEQYRGWYKDRVSERRKEVVRRLDADKARRLEAQENAMEAKIQSFMDMGRTGRAPKAIRGDESRLRQWAVPQVMQDPAFLALVSQYSDEQKTRITAGPKWAEYNRKKRLDKRDADLEKDRAQAEWNKRAAGVATDPKNVEILGEYGISLVDSEGNYRPSQEIINDLKMVRRERGGSGDNLEQIELISEQFGRADTEAAARRRQKREDPEVEDAAGVSVNQRQRALDQKIRLMGRDYRDQLRAGKVPKHKLEKLEILGDLMETGASAAIRGQARTDYDAYIKELDEEYGDIATFGENLSPATQALIREAEGITGGGAGTAAPGGGGGVAELDGWHETTKNGKKYRVLYKKGKQISLEPVE